MSDFIHTGGGTFDLREENVYFIASGFERLACAEDVNKHLLIAVNELYSPESLQFLTRVTDDPQKRIFLDSGVYNLAMTYARKHGVSHNVGLSMAPDAIDGFAELLEKYVELVRSYGDKLWGYIEIDQGGRENKIKTRARLEKLGLRPIPVYHPFTDGWDYFDYLAERYDRICFGNIVQADRATRRRLVATAWERHRKYPHLWIHLLGLTPNEWLNALPINSGDSSSWLASVRWTNARVQACGSAYSNLGQGYRYVLGSDADGLSGSKRAVKLAAYDSRMNMLIWRKYMQHTRNLGVDMYPPPSKEIVRASEL